MVNARVLLLLSIIVSTATIISARPINATNSGPTLSVNPSRISAAPLGSTVSLTVNFSGFPVFNSYDVLIKVNKTVLYPTSIMLNNASFSHDLVLTDCINAVCSVGHGYGGDGPGVVHVAASSFTNAIGSGALFSINYTSIGSPGSNVAIVNDVVSDPSGTAIQHLVVDGLYGTLPPQPDFKISANLTSLQDILGSTNSTGISVASLYGFSGNVSMSTHVDQIGLKASVNATITLRANAAATAILIVSSNSSTPQTQYPVTITALYGTISHSMLVYVSVVQPVFIISAFPEQLRIHAGSSASTTITVTSRYGFSANISLQVMPPPAGVIATLSVTSITLPANGIVNSTLAVTTPLSDHSFEYSINVTGTSPQQSHFIIVDIVPPKADVRVIFSQTQFAVQPGGSANCTITIYSQDYLFGPFAVSVTLSGGTALISPAPIAGNYYLDTNSNFTLTLSVMMDSLAAPGNYPLTLTIYHNRPDGSVLSHTYPFNVAVSVPQSIHHSASAPITIFGLTPLVYFTLLGVLAALLAVLSIQTYRKSRED